MTEQTNPIPVIEGESVCCWCRLEFHRDLDRNGHPVPPITLWGRRFHTVCVRAYARDVLLPPAVQAS